MANHGALAVGDDPRAAWERMETLEQLARVTLVTRSSAAITCCRARGRAAGGVAHASGYPPPVCDPAPRAAAARGPRPAPAAAVTLSETELVKLVTEAVERFRS
jgi:hypothetical protein